MVVSSDEDINSTKIAHRGTFGWRHIQVFMLMLAITMSYLLKINLSTLIVEMTNKNSTTGYTVFNWTQSEQDLTLSALFWGYMVTQVPAGILSQRYGPKWFILMAILSNVLLNALSPVACEQGGWVALCAVRVLQGLTQGFVYPSTHTMLSQWVPPIERGRWSTIVYSGKAVGSVISLATTGLLAGSSLGWPSGFYVPAAVGAVWCVAWIALTADSPASSRFASGDERKYIEESLGDTSSGEEKYPTPWVTILTSLPMWVIIINHSGQSFGNWVLLTKLPAYMTDVLGYSIETGGLDSALPYICLLFLSFVVSWLVPILARKFTVAFTRKFFNSLGMIGAGISLLLLAYLDTSEDVAILLLTIAGGCEAGTFAGYLVNHIDLSPNFGGAMMGVSNAIATLVAIFVPILVGLITGDADDQSKEETVSRWNIVFFLCTAVFFVSDFIFVVFGKATVQSWNTPKEELKTKESPSGTS